MVFWEVSSAIFDVGWVRRFHDFPSPGGTGLFFVMFCAWYVVDAPMVAVWLRYDVLLCVICGWAGMYIQFTIKVPSKYPAVDAATGDSACGSCD